MELKAIAGLLHCPKYGTKEQLIVKILALRSLRFKLATFPSTLDGARQLASEKRKEDIKAMASEAGTWKSGNKVQLAVALISWRDYCRHQGSVFFAEQKRLAEQSGVQLQFSMV